MSPGTVLLYLDQTQGEEYSCTVPGTRYCPLLYEKKSLSCTLAKRSPSVDTNFTMADDLDDFFNEIEEVEQEIVEKETPEDVQTRNKPTQEGIEPPAKRPKSESAPIRPRGLIVAAASSAVTRKPAEVLEDTHQASSGIPNGVGTGSNVSSSSLPTSAPPPIPPPPPQAPPLPPLPNQQQQQQHVPPLPQQSKHPIKRTAAGKVWVDPTLDEWPENDFRIFCGNLDKGVTDQQLHDHYKKYASLAKAKVVQDTKGTSKGYGFVSFLQPLDCAKAIRETDQTWLGPRPIRVKRSDWKDRNMSTVMKNNKKQEKQRKRMGL